MILIRNIKLRPKEGDKELLEKAAKKGYNNNIKKNHPFANGIRR